MSSRKRGRDDDGEDVSMVDSSEPYAQSAEADGQGDEKRQRISSEAMLKKCIATKLADLKKQQEEEAYNALGDGNDLGGGGGKRKTRKRKSRKRKPRKRKTRKRKPRKRNKRVKRRKKTRKRRR